MPTDFAAFRDEDLIAIWGSTPKCVLSLESRFVDKAHILGRGEDFGIKPNDPRRVYLSSVFNFIPLSRGNHAGPHRDHPLMRRLFLELARKKVHYAMGIGTYEQRPEDSAFLTEIYYPWLDKNKSWLTFD